jgi:flagellar biosynthetic protein FlhB
MAEGSEQEKTEEATPRKRQEAMDEGRIPRSIELQSAAFLLAAAFVVNFIAPIASTHMVSLFGSGLRAIGGSSGSPAEMLDLLQGTGRELLLIVAALAGALSLSALAVGALQGRGVLSTSPLMPKLERLNPIANAGRFVGWQPIADLLKALLKVGIVGWAVYRSLAVAWPDIADLSSRDTMGMVDAMRHYTVRLLVSAGVAYLILACADYVFQLWQHSKRMRMSKDEVKRESKQQDGDPLLKSRMRAIARSRIRRQMFRDVAKADVVIVNPTHIAVALQYDAGKAPAPIVLAMGERKVAERIKQLAFEHGVPVIENKALARALIGAAQVGAMIPAELYAAVAEVLAFVIRQRARYGAWRDGRGTVSA